MDLVKLTVDILQKGFQGSLFCIFLAFIPFSMYFVSSYYFLEIISKTGKRKKLPQRWATRSAQGHWSHGLAAQFVQ
jgi:hypothetical protein